MAQNNWRLDLEQKVAQKVEDTSPKIKANSISAYHWAKDRLMRREGAGHSFHIIRDDGGYRCAFAKPSWSGDHCSKIMETGALAIVRAIHEYENGM